MRTIATLITCHNRREKTLACLEALFKCSLPPDVSNRVILVDDGSSDGTSESVRQKHPEVLIIEGTGSLFWAGGMRVAYAAALVQGHDFYLWLNDDTVLCANALAKALDTVQRFSQRCVAVGTTKSKYSESPTYGGFKRESRGFSLRHILLQPGDEPVECDQMNGNMVLIPQQIAQAVGNIDKSFTHGLGDIDYGLRVRKAGFRLVVVPGYVGDCEHNPLATGHTDLTLGLLKRLRLVFSSKAFPPYPWLVFTSRHAGPLWPLHWIKPYVDVVLTSFRSPQRY